MNTRILGCAVLLLALGCQSRPGEAPAVRSAPVTSSTPPNVATTSAEPASPVVTMPPGEPGGTGIDARNAAGREAVQEMLQRGLVPPQPRPQDTAAAAPGETHSEQDLAAARETLPALQDHLGAVLHQQFTTEALRRALMSHPQFKKE